MQGPRFLAPVLFFLSAASASAQLPKALYLQPVDAFQHGLRLLQLNENKELEFRFAPSSSPIPLAQLSAEQPILVRALGYEDLLIPWLQLELGDSLFQLRRLGVHLNDFPLIGLRLPQFASGRQGLRLERKAIDDAQAPTTADLLERNGVFVQRSQMGGGSPVLRGFEASRILLVVDGIRLNHAAFRSGHLQQIIRNDAMAMESIDLVFGSGTVAFGSDALGGLIQMNTLPLIFTQEGHISGHVQARFSTASLERTLHADAAYSRKKWAGLTSFSFSDFSDLRQGALTDPRDSGRWDARFSVRRINGKDSLFLLANPNIQTNSRYGQINLLQKAGYQGKHLRHYLNFQYASTLLVPRYDRLSDTNSQGLPLFARWDYGPEEQLLLALHTEKVQKGRFQWSQAFSWQQFRESRIVRRFQSPWQHNQNELIQVWGYSWQGSLAPSESQLRAKGDSPLSKADQPWLRFGFDAQYNRVCSAAQAFQVDDSTTQAAQTRYPDAGSSQFQAGFWSEVQLLSTAHSLLQFGGRLQINSLAAQFSDTLFFPFPFSHISYLLPAANGSLTYTWQKLAHRIRSSLSSGFRAPNVDDIAKVFDSQPGLVVVPNPSLGPEYLFGFETEYRISTQGQQLMLLGFLSHAPGLLALQSAQFSGQDSLLYQGQLSAVASLQNAASAWICGAQFRYKGSLSPRLQANAMLNYTYGRQYLNAFWQPIDHIPPLHGQLGIEWSNKHIDLGLRVDFSGWKRLEDYGLLGEDNLRYATPNGMPAWWSINSHFQWRLREGVSLRLQLNNILDLRYRVFSSGISAPGRNFMVSLSGSF
jgi:hemoglobin/transferrin/lactoferrin receptor protein